MPHHLSASRLAHKGTNGIVVPYCCTIWGHPVAVGRLRQSADHRFRFRPCQEKLSRPRIPLLRVQCRTNRSH